MEQASHDMNNHNHSIQRKAAIAWGKCTDHQGQVTVSPIPNFNLDKTIFTTLEGRLPRMVIEAKIANKNQKIIKLRNLNLFRNPWGKDVGGENLPG